MVTQEVLRAILQTVAFVGCTLVTAASALTPPKPEYWVVTLADELATIDKCRKVCNSSNALRVGGWVATVKNEYEQRLLYAAVKASSSTRVLLGASRSPSNRSEFRWTEGPLNGTVFWVGLTYQSSGAHAIGYTNFDRNQPDDWKNQPHEEDSLEIVNGKWNDVHTPSSGITSCACQTFPTFRPSGLSCTNEMSMSPSISEALSSSAAVTSVALSASISTTLSLSRSLLSHLSSVTSTPGVSLTPSASFTYTSTLSISPSSSSSLSSSSSITESLSRTYPSRVSLSSSHSQKSSPSSSKSLSSYSITRLSSSNSVSNTSTESSSSPRSLTHDSLSVSTSLTMPMIPLLKYLDMRDTQTTVVALSVVSVGTGGGDLSAAASMVLLSVASCSSSSSSSSPSSSAQSTAPSMTRYLISPFWALGGVWTAVGNLLLVVIVCGMQAGVIGIASIVTRTSFSELATGKGRFPAMAVMVADYFLPGAVMGAVLTLAEGGHDAVGRGLGVAVLVCCCVYVVAAILFVHLVLAPRSSWVLYCSYPTAAARAWDTLLYPAGRWAPKAIRNAFGPVLGPVTRRWTALGSIERIVSVLIAAICGLEGNAACRPLLLIVAVLCFIRCAVFAAMRPLRLPMNAVVVPVTSAVFGTVCVLKYVASTRGGGSTDDVAVESAVRLLQIFQAVLQVWRVWWEMWIAYREAQWDLACNETVGGETSMNVVTAMATAVWFGGGGASRDVIAAFLSSSLGDEDEAEAVEQPRTIAAASMMTSLLRGGDGDSEDEEELQLVPIPIRSTSDHDGNFMVVDVFSRRDDKKEEHSSAYASKTFAGIENYFLLESE